MSSVITRPRSLAPSPRRVAGVAALALSLLTTAARAQSSATPAAEQEALAEARRGVAARREGRDDEARAAFERSLSLAPRASVRAQLGFALQALGRWVEAEASLLAANDPRDAWVQRHRATLDEALVAARAHLGTLTLTADPADAVMRVDGVTVRAGEALRLPVGTVTVSAAREGYYGTERAVVIGPGDALRERFALRPRAPEPATVNPLATREPPPPAAVVVAPPVVAPPERPRSRVVPAVLLGAGVVVVGAGVALWIARGDALDEVLAQGCVETPDAYRCAASAAGADAARSAHARAETYAGASAAAVAVGAALAITGAGWWIVEALRPHARPVTTGVTLAPGGVRWTF